MYGCSGDEQHTCAEICRTVIIRFQSKNKTRFAFNILHKKFSSYQISFHAFSDFDSICHNSVDIGKIRA